MGLTVSRQTAINLTINSQKREIFTWSSVKKPFIISHQTVQQGLSNLTISAAHLGLQLKDFKESF